MNALEIESKYGFITGVTESNKIDVYVAKYNFDGDLIR